MPPISEYHSRNELHQSMNSAIFSARPGQPDFGFWSIWCMQKLGLIHDVKPFDTKPFDAKTFSKK